MMALNQLARDGFIITEKEYNQALADFEGSLGDLESKKETKLLSFLRSMGYIGKNPFYERSFGLSAEQMH
jgi:hypothetical protein